MQEADQNKENYFITFEKIKEELAVSETYQFKIRIHINSYLFYINTKIKKCQRRKTMENFDDGNIFELIAEECYYDDKWREEEGID